MTNRELGLWSETDTPKSYGREQKPDPDGYKIVSVRLREAEFLGFAEHANAVGLTNNMALRIAARRIAGFLEVDRETRRLLQDISRNIGHIAASLAALRKAAQQGDPADMEILTRHRLEFGREFSQLDTLLQRLLNTSKRRRDGRTLLIDSMQQ